MPKTITIVLPDKLLNFILNKSHWYTGNTCIDEFIADVINDHLNEYWPNYFTNMEEWEKIKAETYIRNSKIK